MKKDKPTSSTLGEIIIDNDNAIVCKSEEKNLCVSFFLSFSIL